MKIIDTNKYSTNYTIYFSVFMVKYILTRDSWHALAIVMKSLYQKNCYEKIKLFFFYNKR